MALVHTKSSYFEGEENVSPMYHRSDLSSIVQMMRTNESNFYQSYFPDCTSFNDFISRIRRIVSNPFIQQDAEVIRNFSAINNRLINILEKYFKANYTINSTKTIRITFNFKNEKNEQDFNNTLKALEINSTDDNMFTLVSENKTSKTLDFGLNVKGVKSFMNEFSRYASQRKKTYKTDSQDITAINEYLKSLETEQLINLDNGLIKQFTVTEDLSKYNTPFSNKAADLKAAAAASNGSAIRTNIVNDMSSIKNIIKTEMGITSASKTMQKAFEDAWAANISPDILNYALFMKGGSNAALKGAFGEFNVALKHYYITNSIMENGGQSPKSSILTAIISDTLQSGEQSKVDVTLLNKFGIQAKNYSSISRRVEANKHPGELEGVLGSSFINYLVNACFNTDIGKPEAIIKKNKKEILQLTPEIMSMITTIGGVSSFGANTVTFYDFGGMHFIPASHILESFIQNNFSQADLSITYSQRHSDDFYNKHAKGKKPVFVSKEYFIGNMVPGTRFAYNDSGSKKEFSNLANHYITLRIKFSLQDLISSGSYSIF